jgi:expansin (peptidoglycan-binding protein)
MMRRVVVCAAVVACGGGGDGGGGSPSPTGVLSGEVVQGIATYYDTADGSGNCGFDPTPNDLDVAAFDLDDYAGSAACGECVRVTGPKGTVTVRIVDSCPPCDHHHLDLSPSAFAKIADTAAGRVDITYQAVACNVMGNLAYHFKDGSSQYWTAIQVRNHRIPVAKLELEKAGAFVEVKREDYNYFVDPSGAGGGAVHVRVTGTGGSTVDDVLPGVVADETVSGGAQL